MSLADASEADPRGRGAAGAGAASTPQRAPAADPFDTELLHEREMVRRLARILQEIWAIEVQRCLALSMGLDVVPEQVEQASERRSAAELALLRAEARLRQLDAAISRLAPMPSDAAATSADPPSGPVPLSGGRTEH